MKPIRVLAPLAIVSILLALDAPPASAQSCHWAGTAPFCDGECGDNETELTRLDAVPSHWTAPFVVQNPPFGEPCATGSKALCCSAPGGRTCRWNGTAPFCDGECSDDEVQAEPPEGSSGGQPCATGRKVYCCSKVGTSRQPLKIAAIRNGAGKCLDVHEPDQHLNGGRVQAWDCNNSPQQTWMLIEGTIRSHAGKCLDVHEPDQHLNGGRVQVWDCNNSPQQTWTIAGQSLRSHAGKCLDVHLPDQHLNGAKVQVWDCNNSVQQTWITP